MASGKRGGIDFLAKKRENIDSMVSQTPEKGLSTVASAEKAKLTVSQPAKLQELNKLLESFENLNVRVREKTGEDSSSDLGAAGGTSGAMKGQASGSSARDQAIEKMPTTPAVLQKQLSSHIQNEVHHLEKLAGRLARSTKPGSAFRLNELYARIRRLNALLAEILEASIEVLRRLFIRVFIDKQPIL
jgi:hypothetical protein